MSLLDDEFDIGSCDNSLNTQPLMRFETPNLQNELVGHSAQKELVLRLFSAGKMPHGWVLNGPSGVGKETFAYLLAKHVLSNGGKESTDLGGGLFGEPEPSEIHPPKTFTFSPESPVVKRIESGGHGDLLTISPEEGGKGDIKVDTIRNVVKFLQKTSSEGGWRVVVINQADSMNNAAQNALLKILEEPPAKTLLMLVTTSVARMLPTIRSRCRMLSFSNLTKPEMTQLISASDILSVSDLSVDDAYSFSGGSFGALQKFLSGSGRLVFETLIEGLEGVPNLNRQKLMDVSHKITANKKGKDFYTFLNLWSWWLENLIKHIAGVHSYTPIIEAEFDIIKTLTVEERIVEKLVELWDKINALKTQAEWANQDQQTVILQSYYLFEDLFKN